MKKPGEGALTKVPKLFFFVFLFSCLFFFSCEKEERVAIPKEPGAEKPPLPDTLELKKIVLINTDFEKSTDSDADLRPDIYFMFLKVNDDLTNSIVCNTFDMKINNVTKSMLPLTFTPPSPVYISDFSGNIKYLLTLDYDTGPNSNYNLQDNLSGYMFYDFFYDEEYKQLMVDQDGKTAMIIYWEPK